MFKYVHHVHYVIRDRDAMVEYFLKNFGMKPSQQCIIEPDARFPFQAHMACAYYDVGHTQIQMTQPLDPNSNMGKRLATQGAGVWHVAWAVDNIQKVHQELIAKGNKLRGEDGTPRNISRVEGGAMESSPHGYDVINIDHSCSHGLRIQLAGT